MSFTYLLIIHLSLFLVLMFCEEHRPATKTLQTLVSWAIISKFFEHFYFFSILFEHFFVNSVDEFSENVFYLFPLWLKKFFVYKLLLCMVISTSNLWLTYNTGAYRDLGLLYELIFQFLYRKNLKVIGSNVTKSF